MQEKPLITLLKHSSKASKKDEGEQQGIELLGLLDEDSPFHTHPYLLTYLSSNFGLRFFLATLPEINELLIGPLMEESMCF